MNSIHCAGCYNNDYNYGLGGASKCWNLESAKLIRRKKVPVDQVPPWTQKAQKVPSCYRKPGYVFVEANQTC